MPAVVVPSDVAVIWPPAIPNHHFDRGDHTVALYKQVPPAGSQVKRTCVANHVQVLAAYAESNKKIVENGKITNCFLKNGHSLLIFSWFHQKFKMLVQIDWNIRTTDEIKNTCFGLYSSWLLGSRGRSPCQCNRTSTSAPPLATRQRAKIGGFCGFFSGFSAPAMENPSMVDIRRPPCKVPGSWTLLHVWPNDEERKCWISTVRRHEWCACCMFFLVLGCLKIFCMCTSNKNVKFDWPIFFHGYVQIHLYNHPTKDHKIHQRLNKM